MAAYAMGPLCYRMRSKAQGRAQKNDSYGRRPDFDVIESKVSTRDGNYKGKE